MTKEKIILKRCEDYKFVKVRRKIERNHRFFRRYIKIYQK